MYLLITISKSRRITLYYSKMFQLNDQIHSQKRSDYLAASFLFGLAWPCHKTPWRDIPALCAIQMLFRGIEHINNDVYSKSSTNSNYIIFHSFCTTLKTGSGLIRTTFPWFPWYAHWLDCICCRIIQVRHIVELLKNLSFSQQFASFKNHFFPSLNSISNHLSN